MQHDGVDVVVVGAGIVGLATARAILVRYPGTRLVVLEKEAEIAQHQTGHNSGVIHSGLYYAPGSLKARLCVEGSAALMHYCDLHGIPYRRCGKVVVATEPQELPRLEELYQRGLANGVPGLEMIGPERLREIEPHAAGLRALFSPNTGIVDYGQVAAAFADDIRLAGGEIRLNSPVHGIEHQDSAVQVTTPRSMLLTNCLIACAGLHSDRVAVLSGARSAPRIVPFRGDYYLLRPERRHLIRGLIYPVPDPAFPFLGIHSTLRIDGSVWFGPNAVLAFAREGYHRWDVNLRDLWDALSYRGFRTLARTFWRTGLAEMVRDWSKVRFAAAVQRFVPELTPTDLLPGPSGIRAQALAPDGKLVDDFVIDRDGPIIHVRNAPSPAATSSLTIAERIVDAATPVLAQLLHSSQGTP